MRLTSSWNRCEPAKQTLTQQCCSTCAPAPPPAGPARPRPRPRWAPTARSGAAARWAGAPPAAAAVGAHRPHRRRRPLGRRAPGRGRGGHPPPAPTRRGAGRAGQGGWFAGGCRAAAGPLVPAEWRSHGRSHLLSTPAAPPSSPQGPQHRCAPGGRVPGQGQGEAGVQWRIRMQATGVAMRCTHVSRGPSCKEASVAAAAHKAPTPTGAARMQMGRCSSFREAAEVVGRQAFPMFLNVSANVTNWNADATECSLVGFGANRSAGLGVGRRSHRG
jgi:hypothetical protein